MDQSRFQKLLFCNRWIELGDKMKGLFGKRNGSNGMGVRVGVANFPVINRGEGEFGRAGFPVFPRFHHLLRPVFFDDNKLCAKQIGIPVNISGVVIKTHSPFV